MRERKRLIEKIITFSLPLLFIIIVVSVLVLQPRAAKVHQQEIEAEEEIAVINSEPELVIERQQTDFDSEQVEEWLSSMSLEEKIAQMFIITPEALTGTDDVTAAGETTKSAYETYPVGGLIYFENNIQTKYQITEMLTNMMTISKERVGVPVFLSIDEEGGTVARTVNSGAINEQTEAMLILGQSEAVQKAYAVGEQIGGYLKPLGFNLNFAPVADVLDDETNTVIGNRSFGTDPELVAKMVAEAVKGFKSQGILTTLKHFPGHGATTVDSHLGYAANDKSKEELETGEWLPFAAGITAGTDMIMVGHIALPKVTDEETPATLSKVIITDILRKEMGYSGVIITDAMNMGAITTSYDAETAVVQAIKAGVDMILMPEDFVTAYHAVIAAVQTGEISEQQIEESVTRILRIKAGL